MYYCAQADSDKPWWGAPYMRIVCYAESKDGIHWEKPNLGLCTWNGSRQNNILMPYDEFGYIFSEAEGCWVFIDQHAAHPDTRYKMLLKIAPVQDDSEKRPMLPKGQYMFTASDGIHWKLWKPEKLNPGASDAKFSMFWDSRIQRYVVYSRMKRKVNKHSFRWVGRTVSEDLTHWSKETTAIMADDIDLAGSPDGMKRVDIYDPNVSQYTEAPNIYLALSNFFYHWVFDPELELLPATMDLQLVTSRDGIHWNRTPKRKPFVRLGPRGTFWSKMLYPSGNVIRVGDELWIYVAGHNVAHNKEQDKGLSIGAYTRAILRLDGFISADADYSGGELITNPLTFTGDRLQLNVDTGAGGYVKIEILDTADRPIAGFAEVDSDEINGNHIRVAATWNGNPSVRSLIDKEVKLRFIMRATKLYSFQFLPEIESDAAM